MDFAAKKSAAERAALPFWEAAEAERAAMMDLLKPGLELEKRIYQATGSEKSALQEELKALEARQRSHDTAWRKAQSEGNALYWPIYNLDIKNPHVSDALEHADPMVLVATMRSREAAILTLLEEIEALVHGATQ